MRAMKYDGKPY